MFSVPCRWLWDVCALCQFTLCGGNYLFFIGLCESWLVFRSRCCGNQRKKGGERGADRHCRLTAVAATTLPPTPLLPPLPCCRSFKLPPPSCHHHHAAAKLPQPSCCRQRRQTAVTTTMLPPPPPCHRQAATAAATTNQHWKPNKIETRDIDTQAYYAILQLCVGCRLMV